MIIDRNDMLSTWNSRYVRKRNAYRAEQACSGKAWLDVKSLREGQNLFVLVGGALNKLDVCFCLGNNNIIITLMTFVFSHCAKGLIVSNIR